MAVPGTLNITYRDQYGQLQSASIADFGQYPIWSTASFSTTQQSPLTLFQQPVGGTKPGASTVTNTRLDTNMTTTGQLDAFGEMLVYALRIYLTPSQGNSASPTITNIPLGDINDIVAKTYQALTTSTEKPLLEGDVPSFPAGGGIFGSSVQNAAEQWNNGNPTSTAGRVLASPIYLPGLTGFRVTTQFYPNALSLVTAREVRYTLDGLRKKAVQ